MKYTGGNCWHTAAELAELALPGMPRTKRKVNERASAEAWALRTGADGQPLARSRSARGGGLEYHSDVLPAAARAALVARGLGGADVSAHAPGALDSRAAQLWRWFDGANAVTKAEAARRLQAVDLVDQFTSAGLNRSAAVAASAAQSSVGASTLWSWLDLVADVAVADRLAFLAPRRTGGGAEAAVDPGAWQFLLSDYLRPEKPTFSSCYWRMVRDYAAPKGISMPIERTLRRKLEREVDARVITVKREGAEALRRKLPSQQRSVADLHACEAVNIDGHKFDVFVRASRCLARFSEAMLTKAGGIDALIDEVIGREGGYSNHPADRGGATRWGVTEQVARAYGYKGDMKTLPRETAASIYKRQYWTDVRFDRIAAIFPRVGAELFDTGINMGQAVAGGFLQRALNGLNRGATVWPDLKVDGIIGQVTIAALDAFKRDRGAAGEAVLLKALDALQGARYFDIAEQRPANEAFLYGWIANRIGQA